VIISTVYRVTMFESNIEFGLSIYFVFQSIVYSLYWSTTDVTQQVLNFSIQIRINNETYTCITVKSISSTKPVEQV